VSMQISPISQFAQAPLLLLIISMMMMQPLSTDLYLSSLPSLVTDFGVSVSVVQLTLSLFVVGFGGAQLVIGPLSDRFGRRPVLLCGLALYVAASALCGLSQSIELLIAARFIQALGCCAAVMIARAIVRDAYEPQDSAKLLARASTWISLAPIVGPIIGSYLQVAFGWRAAFGALGVFSACVMAACILHLPETNQHKNPKATDIAGIIANYRLVLGSREFWLNVTPGAMSYGGIFMFISGSSFVLINVLGVPTQWFGYCFALGVSGYMSGTLVCRRLLKTLSGEQALRIGTACSLTAGLYFLAATLLGWWHWSVVVLAMFLAMASHGINFPVSQAGAISPFPKQAGTAAGLMGAVMMGFAFIVGSIVGATHNGTLYPLAIIAALLGIVNFASVRLIAKRAVLA
jgi:DHA1 family bicyclomycin/chloramphenicol resistance-like MFS transporter